MLIVSEEISMWVAVDFEARSSMKVQYSDMAELIKHSGSVCSGSVVLRICILSRLYISKTVTTLEKKLLLLVVTAGCRCRRLVIALVSLLRT